MPIFNPVRKLDEGSGAGVTIPGKFVGIFDGEIPATGDIGGGGGGTIAEDVVGKVITTTVIATDPGAGLIGVEGDADPIVGVTVNPFDIAGGAPVVEVTVGGDQGQITSVTAPTAPPSAPDTPGGGGTQVSPPPGRTPGGLIISFDTAPGLTPVSESPEYDFQSAPPLSGDDPAGFTRDELLDILQEQENDPNATPDTINQALLDLLLFDQDAGSGPGAGTGGPPLTGDESDPAFVGPPRPETPGDVGNIISDNTLLVDIGIYGAPPGATVGDVGGLTQEQIDNAILGSQIAGVPIAAAGGAIAATPVAINVGIGALIQGGIAGAISTGLATGIQIAGAVGGGLLAAIGIGGGQESEEGGGGRYDRPGSRPISERGPEG